MKPLVNRYDPHCCDGCKFRLTENPRYLCALSPCQSAQSGTTGLGQYINWLGVACPHRSVKGVPDYETICKFPPGAVVRW